MNSEKITPMCDEWKRVKDTEIAHLAGVFDAVGTVTVHISQSDDYRIGYHYKPVLRTSRPKDDSDPLLGKLLAYCDENGVQYTISEQSHGTDGSSESYVWFCHRPESIRRFLEPLLPYLVTQYEKAIVMLEQIVPRMEDDLHLEKEGFLELMRFADMVRKADGEGKDSKYDETYFKEEWSVIE